MKNESGSRLKKKEKLTFFNKSFEEIELIGEGSFGKVYKVKKKSAKNENIYAIKQIKIPQNQAEIQLLKSEGLSKSEIEEEVEESLNKCLDEIKMMQRLKDSDNIVKIEDYEVIKEEDKIEWKINIRMELLTSLDYYFTQKENITNKDILKLGIDICQALRDCNQLKIIHRDIKPDNIFIDDLGHFKLGDFGIARNLEKTSSGLSKKGTYNYMAPEVYKEETYNLKVDIYSLGIVLYRYFNFNRLPFLPPYPEKIKHDDREYSLLLRMKGEEPNQPANATKKESEVILKAIQFHSDLRYKNAQEMQEDLLELYNQEDEIILPKIKTLNEDMTSSSSENKTQSIFSHKTKKGQEKDTSLSHDEPPKKETTLIQDEVLDIDENSSVVPNLLEPEEKDSFDKTRSVYLHKEKKKTPLSKETVIEQENLVYEKAEDKEIVKENKQSDDEKITKSTSQLKTNHAKKKKRKVVALVLLLCFLIIGFNIYKFTTKTKIKYVEVPNLIGMKSEKAIQKLEHLNLAEDIEYQEVDDEEKYGIVLKQNIKDGNVKEHSTIELIVGISKQKVKVPYLVGKTVDEAKEELQKLGLEISVSEQESETVEAGKIISQMLDDKREVNKGTTVEVLVSKGKSVKQEEAQETTAQQEQKTPNNSKPTQPTQPAQPAAPQIVYPNSVKIINGMKCLEKGKSYQLNAVVYPENANDKTLTWKSINNDIVTVSSTGLVTAVGNSGASTIVATIPSVNISTSTAIYVYRKGDANGDGVINQDDRECIHMWFLEQHNYTELERLRCDVDGSGIIDAVDMMALYKFMD